VHLSAHCTTTVHISFSFAEVISLARRLSFQSLALHLQLHLRIFLEGLRLSLAKHLCHPLVRYPSGTEPGGIGRAKINSADPGLYRHGPQSLSLDDLPSVCNHEYRTYESHPPVGSPDDANAFVQAQRVNEAQPPVRPFCNTKGTTMLKSKMLVIGAGLGEHPADRARCYPPDM
jgi:hypothetical protein